MTRCGNIDIVKHSKVLKNIFFAAFIADYNNILLFFDFSLHFICFDLMNLTLHPLYAAEQPLRLYSSSHPAFGNQLHTIYCPDYNKMKHVKFYSGHPGLSLIHYSISSIQCSSCSSSAHSSHILTVSPASSEQSMQT